jgi:hypothetical protein
MKKILLTTVVGVILTTNAFSYYNPEGNVNAFEFKRNQIAVEQMNYLIIITCSQNGAAYARNIGKPEKTQAYMSEAISKCQRILAQYNSIPEGMMPFEKQNKKLKRKMTKKRTLKKILIEVLLVQKN